MQRPLQNRCPGIFLFILLILSCLGLADEPSTIRLRRETITTPPKNDAVIRPQSVESPVSGLYLVQFNQPVTVEWRMQLRQMGVDLLRFVPDHAFIARFRGVRLAQVRDLTPVRWAGEYRPQHRLHESLDSTLTKTSIPQLPEVRILLAPDVSEMEVVGLNQKVRASRGPISNRFGTILQGQLEAEQLADLIHSPAVLWVEPASHPRLHDEVAAKIVGGDPGSGNHATSAQALGYDGRGVLVSVADSGLHRGDLADMHPDLRGRVEGFFYYGNLTDAADENSHGTHVAGIIAGSGETGEVDENGFLYGLGVAPGVHLLAQRIFDGAGNFESPPSNEILTRDAVRAGAVIGSNSWGEDTHGRYDLSAAEFDALVRDADAETPGDQPYILQFSAGNAGPGSQTIGSPAVAKNVIATGASQNNRPNVTTYQEGLDALADFSSRGPCEDGRIKPDLVAPGTWIASLQSAAATDDNAWWPISEYYQFQGGTSQAGPHVSGAAAVFIQYYRENVTNTLPSPALVKAALINAAADMADPGGTGPVPNPYEGWGRVDLTPLISSPRAYTYVDQTQLLATGQSYEHRLYVASDHLPLKITLVYTDEPGLPAAIPALVNDLDLEVVDPEGTLYRGNQFLQGRSVANPLTSDNLNNVEAVHLSAPQPGEYLIRIRAPMVAEDARRDTPAVDQDFALVCSGDLPQPGVGILIMDRKAYSAPQTIHLKLIDFDRAGNDSVTLRLRSSTETNGEPVVLLPQTASGVFAGQMDTVTGPAAVDGYLQINHEDLLEALYVDLSPAGTNLVTARADLLPPLIEEVSSTFQFGKIILTWNTDEPASSAVYYGTNRTELHLTTTQHADTQQHQVVLDNLKPECHYWFYVVSTDPAGNRTTNDNNGDLYEFTTLKTASVLLVNAYTADDPGFDTTFIPLESYTDALDQIQVPYEVWDVLSQGQTPTTNDLRPYRVVIWRLSDSIYNDSTLSQTDQDSLRAYLEGGGALFLASMEILSRLGDGPFRSQVLHVQSFTPDVGAPLIHGVMYDPVTSGINLEPDYSNYPIYDLLGTGPDFSDALTPTTNAAPILLEGVSNRVVGLRYPRTGQDSPGRVVFLSFPFDTLSLDGDSPNNRSGLLHNILSFLTPGGDGLGTLALDSGSYSIPARIIVEVADADLEQTGKTTVKFYSHSDTNGHTIVLHETTQPGLFRGAITLVSATNAPSPGQLRAREGEEIWALYDDLSSQRLVRVSASVDTVPAHITGVGADPSYEEARITWSTSELADALVQFGESAFLGRTAYRADLAQDHELILPNLLPDRTYHYQVVSRDAAGNVTIDNNQGKLYLLHTLTPLPAPWTDSLEPGDTHWLVIDGAYGTTTSWELGSPLLDGLTAHSPVNAWGSNLPGLPADTGDSRLVSPAIDLTGGNRATLRFWHYYDFSKRSELDLTESGQLHLSTNNGKDWSPLVEYTGLSPGWESVEVDLTPYLGKVVRIGWQYRLFSLQAISRVGWLIDDVSISVTNGPWGTLVISNNLAQAQFKIAGPLTQSGRGWDLRLTNAPEGDYVVTFTPVPYYLTPPPQTNHLSGTNTLVLCGWYAFADTNLNGVSDSWEHTFYPETGPPELAQVDTDGDGASDYFEFLSGTNPTNHLSVLELNPPTKTAPNTWRFQWHSAPGYAYQLCTSSNMILWSPVSPWTRAAGTTSTCQYSNAAANEVSFFRLQVLP